MNRGFLDVSTLTLIYLCDKFTQDFIPSINPQQSQAIYPMKEWAAELMTEIVRRYTNGDVHAARWLYR